LHIAASAETSTLTIQYLVDQYPAALQVENKHGRTPYATAKKHGKGKEGLSILARSLYKIHQKGKQQTAGTFGRSTDVSQ